MSLNITNFLCYYQFNPFAEEIKKEKSCCPLIVKVALVWVLTAFIVPLVCRIAFYNISHRIKVSSDNPTTNIVNSVAQTVLNPKEKDAPAIDQEQPATSNLNQPAITTTEPAKKIIKPVGEDESVKVPPCQTHIHLLNVFSGPLIYGLDPKTFLTETGGIQYDKILERKEDPKNHLDDKTIFNQTLLNIPLSYWINPPERFEDQNLNYHFEMNKLSKEKKELINKQIEAWDERINLKDRLRRLRNPETVTLKNLIPEWGKSTLQYSLMLKEEICSLTLIHVHNHYELSIEFVNVVLPKILKFSKERTEPLTEFADLALVDVPRVTKELIAEHQIRFSAIFACFLLPPDLIIAEDFNALNTSPSSLAFLFQNKDFVQKLSLHHIKTWFPMIASNAERAIKASHNLSADQIAAIDFSLINQKLFFAILKNRENEIIPKLPLNVIHQYCHAFEKIHWTSLSDTHAKAFDFKKISQDDPKNKAVKKKDEAEIKLIFEYIFGDEDKSKRIGEMSLDRIYALAPYFDKYWSLLTDAQALQLDFNHKMIKKEMQKEIFTHLFHGDEKSARVRNMELKRIYELVPYFDEEHWNNVPEDKALKFDFNKIEEKYRKTAFNYLFHYGEKAKKLFTQLPVDKIEDLLKYFENYSWPNFSEDQVTKFDFSKIKIFPKKDRNSVIHALIAPLGKIPSRMPKLNFEQIHEVYEYFYEEEWNLITDVQIKGFNFKNADLAFIRKLFSKDKKAASLPLLSNEQLIVLLPRFDEKSDRYSLQCLIPKISLDRIYAIVDHFNSQCWKEVSEQQAIQFDFSKIKDESKRKKAVRAVFEKSSDRFKRLAKMLFEQIHSIYKYFDDIQWTAITEDQVKSFDYSKAEKKFIEKLFQSDRASKFLPMLNAAQVAAVRPHVNKNLWNFFPKDKT